MTQITDLVKVQRALKMFEAELETKDIALGFQIEKSFLDLEVDWVRLDPSRLLQVSHGRETSCC